MFLRFTLDFNVGGYSVRVLVIDYLWTAERMSDRKAVRSLAKQIAIKVLKLCEEAVMR